MLPQSTYKIYEAGQGIVFECCAVALLRARRTRAQDNLSLLPVGVFSSTLVLGTVDEGITLVHRVMAAVHIDLEYVAPVEGFHGPYRVEGEKDTVEVHWVGFLEQHHATDSEAVK